MSNKCLESLKAHDVLVYIDEAEKYILDLIDIILQNHSQGDNLGTNEIGALFKGLESRGICIDLAGKLSMFGHSKGAQLGHEHSGTSHLTGEGISGLTPHFCPKYLKDGYPLNTPLDHAMTYKHASPPVSMKLNTRPPIGTLLSSPLKNYSTLTAIGLTKIDTDSLNNFDTEIVPELNPSSMENSQKVDKIKEKNNGEQDEMCRWTNSSPIIFPSSEKSTQGTKSEKIEPLKFHNITVGLPTSKKRKVDELSFHTPENTVNKIVINGLEKHIKEANNHFNDMCLGSISELACSKDIKSFYEIKITHLATTINEIQNLNMPTNEYEWQLIQNKIKTKLIQMELDQVEGRIEKPPSKKSGYQTYYVFMFEYPLIAANSGKPKTDQALKELYCSSIFQNHQLSTPMESWATRRSMSLSRTKARLATKKNNEILGDIFVFGKKDYTQAFFDLRLINQAFSKTLRNLLLEENKTHNITIASINKGEKLNSPVEEVKQELLHQLQSIYKAKSGQTTSPKIASLSILTNAFLALFVDA